MAMSLTPNPSVRQMRLRISCDDPVFPRLRKVKVKGKDLSLIPRSLFSLTELEILDLSPERESCLFYRLGEVPSEIALLTGLRILALDTNNLRELPAELCLLVNLERLAISNNHLTSLPSGFHGLQALRSLHMANNRFQELPAQVVRLCELRFLDVSNNMIRSIPEAIDQLIHLESLLACYNQITELPSSVCNLTQLQTLWLAGNLIASLPRNFGRLTKLDWVRMSVSSDLDDNPLVHPPIAIAKQGPVAIQKYFALLESREKAVYAKKQCLPT